MGEFLNKLLGNNFSNNIKEEVLKNKLLKYTIIMKEDDQQLLITNISSKGTSTFPYYAIKLFKEAYFTKNIEIHSIWLGFTIT